MILDAEIKEQLAQYIQLMEGEVHIKLSVGTDDISKDMTSFSGRISNDVVQYQSRKSNLRKNA